MDIWSWVAWFFWVFVFVAYLMVVFSIISDIFRDQSLNGWLRAIWIIFLIFVPFLTALVYLIARGSGNAEALDRAGDGHPQGAGRVHPRHRGIGVVAGR